MKTSGFTRTDSDFTSGGLRCAGWLYLPEGVKKPPVIVMAHGLAAQRDFGLPEFAEHFVAQGWAVYLFDYRNCGASEGTPRNLVWHWRHGKDWDRALAHVRSLPDIDSSRMILWGSSFSGGHVIAAATRHPMVTGIVAQVPFVDGVSSLLHLPLMGNLKGSFALLLDGLKMLLRRAPYYIPVVGRPGTFAALATPECYDGYMGIVPEGSDWENKMPARALLSIMLYSPLRMAHKVQCPALLLAGRDDSLIPVKQVQRAAARMAKGEFVELPCNHFAPYQGDMFRENIGHQLKFIHARFDATAGTKARD